MVECDVVFVFVCGRYNVTIIRKEKRERREGDVGEPSFVTVKSNQERMNVLPPMTTPPTGGEEGKRRGHGRGRGGVENGYLKLYIAIYKAIYSKSQLKRKSDISPLHIEFTLSHQKL